ncbi:autophagy-related protein 11-domain-containing protein [Absidia repens]|uniref:Autophagy-related protein 11 n=1 Tax=Absidia repens TaxID=90262 RepID=A0A1X2IFN0_9FUNG|nr:autophagy-related protein 11-domain-containing protein [Absidia repens]
MEEEKFEWHSTSVHMAHKLDDIRKNVFFEVINQLQLPVDENEVGAMTRKISIMDPATQHDVSVFHDILTAMNVIDSGKFVSRVFKKVKNAHELTRRWQKEYKELKEKYTKLTTSAHEKIAFRNFKTGDVALFLPTRNSTRKPWAAFNVNAPHYFLKPSETVSSQMSSREWIVARITSITECLVNAQDSSTNPYGLPDKAVFYQLEVENWRNGRPKHHHRKSKHAKSSPSNSSSSSVTASDINISDSTVNYQRRYTLPSTHGANHRQNDIGLASISSSIIEKSTQLDNSTISQQQQQQQQQNSRLPSPPGPFTRSSSSSIVQSTTVLSSPPSSGDQNFYKDNKSQQSGASNESKKSHDQASSSTTDGIDPSLIWAAGE